MFCQAATSDGPTLTIKVKLIAEFIEPFAEAEL
jgi:hypothetical protein